MRPEDLDSATAEANPGNVARLGVHQLRRAGTRVDVAAVAEMATHPRLGLLPADRAGRVTYRFRTVIVLVARQNGKTLLMIVLALWHVYALKSRTVIGTAQDLANAEGVG